MIHWLLFCLVWAIEWPISAFIAAISVLLSALERISAVLFELASDWYGVPPRASFPTEKSAVLILGAHQGVGRNAALWFSELGYTVFALCPNRQEESGPRQVASLLYIWHNRKERSRSIPWGMLAPMPLNLWSRSQREAVHETVRAHCTNYDLHLVALLISNSFETPDVPDQDAWRISVVDNVTEPVIMACDYDALLSEASGRVIILSNFAERSPIVSLKSRTAAAEHLAEMFEFQGIRVSSIRFGPLAQSHSIDSIPSNVNCIHRNRCSSRRFVWQESFKLLTQKISRQLAVHDDLLLNVIHRIVQSRHPKFTYTVGVYPVLRLALGSAPISARLVVKSFMRWAKSFEGPA